MSEPPLRAGYGLQTALALGVIYWLVHGSVEWLWHMPAVTVPALFLLAGCVACADSGISVRRHQKAAEEHGAGAGGEHKRLDWFRWIAVAVCLFTAVWLGLPSLSYRYEQAAYSVAESDVDRAVAYTATAATLQPHDPEPLQIRGYLLRKAAVESANLAAGEAVLHYLDGALRAYQEAEARDPGSWAVNYQAGIAALDLLSAVRAVRGGAVYAQTDGDDLQRATLPGLSAWTQLSEMGNAGLPVVVSVPRSEEELIPLALHYLHRAHERNPLSAQVPEALSLLSQ